MTGLYFWQDDDRESETYGKYLPLIITPDDDENGGSIDDGEAKLAMEQECCCAYHCQKCLQFTGEQKFELLIPHEDWYAQVTGIGEAWNEPPNDFYDACENNACTQLNGRYNRVEGAKAGCDFIEIGSIRRKVCEIAPSPPDNDYQFNVQYFTLDTRQPDEETCELWMCVRWSWTFNPSGTFPEVYSGWIEGLIITNPPDPWVFRGGTADQLGCPGPHPVLGEGTGWWCDLENLSIQIIG